MSYSKRSSSSPMRCLFVLLLCALFLHLNAPSYAETSSWADLEEIGLLGRYRQNKWVWDLRNFSSGDDTRIISCCSEEGMRVAIIETPDFAWGVAFAVPDRMKNNSQWRTSLAVASQSPQAIPGVELSNGSIGINFQLDAQEAQLRVSDSEELVFMDSFQVRRPTGPYVITLSYDMLTREIAGSISTNSTEQEVFRTRLGHYGLPTLDRITEVIVRTTSPSLYYNNSWVIYRELSLEAH